MLGSNGAVYGTRSITAPLLANTRVPQHDCGQHQIQAVGTITLISKLRSRNSPDQLKKTAHAKAFFGFAFVERAKPFQVEFIRLNSESSPKAFQLRLGHNMEFGTENRQKQTADICKQYLREKY